VRRWRTTCRVEETGSLEPRGKQERRAWWRKGEKRAKVEEGDCVLEDGVWSWPARMTVWRLSTEYDERIKRRRILGSELRRKEFHISCRTDEYER